MLTESEAKTKWCPMGRSQGDIGGGINRWGQEDRGGTRCIGSACMMWRYAHESGPTAQNKVGYCGLAGRPE